jgi:predicted enzyme related to lactoylglutathione lyase
MQNAINWFELFVTDLDRAQRFYEAALDLKLRREEFGGTPMAIFMSAAEGAVGGALVKDGARKPGGGALVYLNANGKLDAVLGRIPKAGGEVVLPKTDIGAPGYIATIRDTEGNVVGLHSER